MQKKEGETARRSTLTLKTYSRPRLSPLSLYCFYCMISYIPLLTDAQKKALRTFDPRV